MSALLDRWVAWVSSVALYDSDRRLEKQSERKEAKLDEFNSRSSTNNRYSLSTPSEGMKFGLDNSDQSEEEDLTSPLPKQPLKRSVSPSFLVPSLCPHSQQPRHTEQSDEYQVD